MELLDMYYLDVLKNEAKKCFWLVLSNEVQGFQRICDSLGASAAHPLVTVLLASSGLCFWLKIFRIIPKVCQKTG